ncbi:FH2 domain-containing protein 1 [Chelonus insularis]|uniref:FH2 domain-containing protein 1 n=1 Tax=Chelonus insularis TaxID=460826 RepID=UPI0015890845|nr:FH2 domain-containing protein 1 [Chelonus insularis]
MDSNVGLDYIVDNPDYCNKLASALDTACTSVKKQVVELLSALCVYSQDGRQRAIDTLHIYQERKGERYRLRAIVDELQKATAEDYQAALLAFINCLVISTPVLKDRVRIRNEFIGLKLLPILNDLRKQKSQYSDLRVQLEVFDDQRETDEELTNQGPPGIDLSSHVDVFYAILGQIADTPQEIPFLSILQHLLRLDPKEPASDLAWDTAETLVHRATLLESREDVAKLLRSPSQTNLCCHCRVGDQTCGSSRKASLPASSPAPPPPPLPATEVVPDSSSVIPPPPPLAPPDPPTITLVPPPPPPLLVNVSTPDVAMEPPLPPPLHVPAVHRVPTPEPPNNNAKLLPQQETPTPKTKMKTINWNKIPNHKVIGKRNIWSLVANEHQNSPMADLDWAEMEGLFCQQIPPVGPPATCVSSNGPGVDAERRRREPTEIALLDGKRSLNVNIFLKQFRSSNEDIIQLIRDGGHDDIGAEKLRGLLKILPEVDELEMLKSFDGDKSKLGNAEKFFLQLIQVPNYKLRIECMLLKEEFAANMSYLEPSISSMILAGEDLMTNKPLQEVLYMVVVAGNFLNSGGYAGNAAGVKLSSLQKLTEIRANKPGMNLIHYVALQAERKRKDLLNFSRNMNALEAATKTTIEQLNNEFNTLDTKIKKIKTQIQLPSTESDIQEQMAQFLQMAEQEMAQLKRDMGELEGVRRSLAEFFCEDINTFKIEECFKIFHQFCQKFNQAIAENERRRIQEEQVNARRRQREEQLMAKKRLLNNQAEVPGSESESNLMDYGLLDIQSFARQSYNRSEAKLKRLQNGGVTSDEDISITGSPSIRRRLGSCSGGPDQQVTKEDTYSPDITPNGTLRRRRSRIPVEDDDNNLMDFLRTSGQENTRERKSWGSLDRSWARRARGQPRRSDLLNADFSGDRERPNSPSPLAENKPFLQEEETKPTGRAWRQKIEAWLSENEKEERAGVELQRKARQLQANRKSFEDSENEGKTNTQAEENSVRAGYSNVYDWRPSVEKTDVMRTMEAIEEVQPQPQTDKSPWRKSSLNVPSSPEEIDPRHSRRHRSRLVSDNVLGSSTLHAIREEERKKNKPTDLLSDGQDELTIYLRAPCITAPSSAVRRFSKSNKKINEEDKVSDKIEIDSDNIETPPVTRRVFSPPREVKPVEKEPCKRERCNSSLQGKEVKVNTTKPVTTSSDLGSGNFDRYAAARKTRRYKKNQENPLDKDQIGKQDSENTEEKPQRPSTLALTEDSNLDEDQMLKVWQDKLKRRHASNDMDSVLAEIAKSGEELQKAGRPRHSRLPISQPAPVLAVTNTVLSPVMQESRPREMIPVWPERAISCRERHRSMIDPSQVKEALSLTNNPPSQVNNESNTMIIGLTSDHELLPVHRVPSPEPQNDQVDQSVVDVNRLNEIQNNQVDSTMDIDEDKMSTSPPKESTLFKRKIITDINISSSSPLVVKGKEQELNDEGFEETQSLVSESLSQETSSGNYETDIHDTPRCSPAEMHFVEKDSGENKKRVIGKDEIARLKAFRPRTGSSNQINNEKSSFLPKKSESPKREVLKKTDSNKKIVPLIKKSSSLRNEVEKSGSRSSLKSSRSSLNSATSVNTVRKLAPSHTRLRGYNTAIAECAMTSDLRKNTGNTKGLSSSTKENDKRQTASRTSVTRIPASRSSSSGSSVGPVARNIKKVPNGLSDLSNNVAVRPRPVVTRSSSSVSTHPMLQNRTVSSRTLTSTPSRSKLVQPRNHSFMRPTTSSVNKGSIPNLPKSIKSMVK